jgi:hypothetical protein
LDTQVRTYRGATPDEARQAYYADALEAADFGWVAIDERWSAALGVHTLSVTYVLRPEEAADARFQVEAMQAAQAWRGTRIARLAIVAAIAIGLLVVLFVLSLLRY